MSEFNRRPHRLIIAAIAIVFIAAILGWPQLFNEFNDDYACSDSYTIAEPITWVDEANSMVPIDVITADAENWRQLVRHVNHFTGADTTQLVPGDIILIPRHCQIGEKPPGSTPTFQPTRPG